MRHTKTGLTGFGSWVKSAHLPALQYDGRAEITAVAAATEKTRHALSVAWLNSIGLTAEESKDTGNWAEVRRLF